MTIYCTFLFLCILRILCNIQIWFKQVVINKKKSKHNHTKKVYLHDKLLKLIKTQAMRLLNELENDMNILREKHISEWNQIIKCQVNKYTNIQRQDKIFNGLILRHNYDININQKFYDQNIYLPQILMIAQNVDNKFQECVKNVFNINNKTNIGYIYDDEKYQNVMDDQVIQIEYVCGKIKSIDEIRNDLNEKNIKSVEKMDYNHCSLIFQDIYGLCHGLKLFMKQIECHDEIVEIVAMNNGFKEYLKERKYVDIKLYCLIKGDRNNIIGEIQFTLSSMEKFKKNAADLCTITRQKEFVEKCLKLDLYYLLLNKQKQLIVAANMNNKQLLCDLMIIDNKINRDIFNLEVLGNIIKLKNFEMFKFIVNMIENKHVFIECLFKSNEYNSKPMGEILQSWPYEWVKYVINTLDGHGIIDKLTTNSDEIFRFLWRLWSNNDINVIDFIMNKMKITKKKMIDYMRYRYNDNNDNNDKGKNELYLSFKHYSIITRIIEVCNIGILRKLKSIIGDLEFVKLVFIPNGENINGVEKCIQMQKYKHLKYLLSFIQIENHYLFNDHQLYRIFLWCFMTKNEEIYNLTMKKLKITNKKIIKFMDYNYIENKKLSNLFATIHCKYDKYNVLDRVIWNNQTVQRLKDFVEIIGNEKFIEYIFIKNGFNMNGIEYCIKSKNVEMMNFIMSFKEIRKKAIKNPKILFGIIWWMSHIKDDSMSLYLIRTLELGIFCFDRWRY